jgi:hypothetical protein
MIQNFIESIIGTVTKTEVNGRCVWVLPCDLDGEIPGFPRDPNIGVLCYFKDIIEGGTVGQNNDGANVGGAVEVYQGKVGVTLNFRTLIAGANITITQNTDTITIGFSFASVPASATAAGTAGQVAYDANFAYFCTAPNTWRRVALATW